MNRHTKRLSDQQRRLCEMLIYPGIPLLFVIDVVFIFALLAPKMT